MTRPTLPPGSEVPPSTVNALHALYHEAAAAEPGPMLDRSILDAARAELQVDLASQPRRPQPWWKGWLPATSAVAVALVGLSVTWRVIDEQERRLREETRAAQTAAETTDKAAPAQRPVEAKSAINAQAPAAEKSRGAESAAAKDAPIGVPEPAAPASMAPALAKDAVKKTRRAEMDDLPEKGDAAAAMESAPSPARAAGKLEARRPSAGGASGANGGANGVSGASAATDSLARRAADPATPDLWLQHIRELRTVGRNAEAAQSLARFRARYPDFVLPDDLLNLK